LAKNISVRCHPYSRMVGIVYFDDIEVKLVGTTGIKEPGNIVPADFYVYQNYPNPFNPSTTIRYNIPQSSNVSVKIYNMLGQEIKTLFAGNLNSGVHSVIWNGDTNSGTKAASGTYIFMVKYNGQFQVKKMILLK
jgi:flagellar hook assembly protein FlgD